MKKYVKISTDPAPHELGPHHELHCSGCFADTPEVPEAYPR
ncbi:MAG: hypothetical protein Q6352_008550 [Candidatus Freyrarchaeum guaymaensis]